MQYIEQLRKNVSESTAQADCSRRAIGVLTSMGFLTEQLSLPDPTSLPPAFLELKSAATGVTDANIQEYLKKVAEYLAEHAYGDMNDLPHISSGTLHNIDHNLRVAYNILDNLNALEAKIGVRFMPRQRLQMVIRGMLHDVCHIASPDKSDFESSVVSEIFLSNLGLPKTEPTLMEIIVNKDLEIKLPDTPETNLLRNIICYPEPTAKITIAIVDANLSAALISLGDAADFVRYSNIDANILRARMHRVILLTILMEKLEVGRQYAAAEINNILGEIARNETERIDQLETELIMQTAKCVERARQMGRQASTQLANVTPENQAFTNKCYQHISFVPRAESDGNSGSQLKTSRELAEEFYAVLDVETAPTLSGAVEAMLFRDFIKRPQTNQQNTEAYLAMASLRVQNLYFLLREMEKINKGHLTITIEPYSTGDDPIQQCHLITINGREFLFDLSTQQFLKKDASGQFKIVLNSDDYRFIFNTIAPLICKITKDQQIKRFKDRIVPFIQKIFPDINLSSRIIKDIENCLNSLFGEHDSIGEKFIAKEKLTFLLGMVKTAYKMRNASSVFCDDYLFLSGICTAKTPEELRSALLNLNYNSTLKSYYELRLRMSPLNRIMIGVPSNDEATASQTEVEQEVFLGA